MRIFRSLTPLPCYSDTERLVTTYIEVSIYHENMPEPTYVLEVVRFLTEQDEWLAKGGKFEHVGYMKGNFRTKKNAASYYDRHNPHMRSLNAHNTYRSDWDPDTELLYIVREDHDVNGTVDCFCVDDNPRDEIVNGVGTAYIRWLK